VSPPEPRAYGLELQVGLPGHLVRHGLPACDPSWIGALAREMSAPGTFLKVCASGEDVARLLPPHWEVTATHTMMSTTLFPPVSAPGSPAEFVVSEVDRAGPVLSVEIRMGGELAANGRAALHDDCAVFDQIETRPAHQRRGLGRLVMLRLSQAACAAGATRGLLVATEEGRALYATLGWRVECPLTTAARRAVVDEHPRPIDTNFHRP
jgi:GNAT superfamily N-acetyltransferase